MAAPVLVTGGAGFIGANLVARLLGENRRVVVLDNLSRGGSRANLEWLKSLGGDLVLAEKDVRDYAAVAETLAGVGEPAAVFHLAGQVAVTTSVEDPETDFDTNARGTFHVLEALRRAGCQVPFLYSSTNKVYGGMQGVGVGLAGDRYAYSDHARGIGEDFPLDFHSPYGCSKGAADQYTVDYARIYGLPNLSFRQSCIYGPHQFGVEDQGWVAWFAIRAVQRRPVTIFGDGKQVRDVLYVDDLVDLYLKALARPESFSGRAYNVGGGPANTLSLLELIARLDEITGRELEFSFADWRPGDQKIFVCDIAAAQRDFQWTPAVDPAAGVAKITDWVRENISGIESVLA